MNSLFALLFLTLSTAGYSLGAATLSEALEAGALTWSTGGDVPWFGQTATNHDGVDAAQSGTLEPFQNSWMETSITGPATVTFWWKNPLRSDWLQLFIDGSNHSGIVADSEWRQQLVNLPAGPHTLRWTISRYYMEQGNAWLDEVMVTNTAGQPPVVFLPPASQTVADGTNVAFQVESTGEAPFGYQWQRDGLNLASGFPIYGATEKRLSIYFASFDKAGEYRVIVTNACGAVTSAVAVLTVLPSAPWISSWFYDNYDAGLGAPVDLTGNLLGTAPLHFQWLRDGVNLANATNGTFHLDAAAVTDAGNYRVVITNLYGSVTSPAVQLTISSNPPVIFRDLTNQTVVGGVEVEFNLNCGGTQPISFQWQKNGQPMALEFQTDSYYLYLPAVTTADAGNYRVVLSNSFGMVTSAVVSLAVVAATLADAVDAVGLPWSTGGDIPWFGQTTTSHDGVDAAQAGALTNNQNSWLETTVIGPANVSFWWKNPTESDELEFRVNGSIHSAIYHDSEWRQQLANLPAGPHTLRWIFTRFGSGTESAWLDEVTVTDATGQPPAVIVPPASQTVADGTNVSFAVALTGETPFGCQWQRDGTDLMNTSLVFGVTGQRLEIFSASFGEAGEYRVIVTNAWGAVTSAVAVLTVIPSAPWISRFYDTYDAGLGAPADLTGGFAGTAPLSFQWLQDGINLVHGTNATLHLDAAAVTDAGSYRVVITNLYGSVTSSVLVLTISSNPPVITGDLTNQTVLVGASVEFAIHYGGSWPITFQWQKNGRKLASQTSAYLVLPSPTEADTGHYQVVLSNAFGTATSAVALLVVGEINPLAAAVDAPELVFTTFGNADWFAQTTNTYDGTNAIQSGSIADQQASWLLTKLVGPGTLSFWWSASSEAGNDRLEYWVEGIYGGQRSGQGGWQQRIVGIPPGTNQIVWCYSKNDNLSAGSDAAWLDRVAFRPQPTEIVLNPALDNDSLVFTNTRGLWIPQTAVTHDGVDAAEAQAGPDGFSELITEVQGPGMLRFWWKQDDISSGAFAFYVNDSLRAEITVTGEWSEVTLTLNPGANSLRWNANNPTAPGYLDEVRFQSSPLLLPIFVVEPTNASVLVGETIHLPALATGPGPLSYRLLFNGSESDYLPDGDTNGVTFHVLATSIYRSGQYEVVACNLSGCVTSAPATITVHAPAKVVVGPQPKWVLKRRAFSLSAVADGSAPLTYQWLLAGVPVLGATNGTFLSASASYDQAGHYSVRVSNPYGTNTSPTARVIVAPVFYTARNLGCLNTNYGSTSMAYDVNNSGLVVGATSVADPERGANDHAFLWLDPGWAHQPNGAMFDLDNRESIDPSLRPGNSRALGINDRGEVVGYYEHRTNSENGYAHAAVWHPNINAVFPGIAVSPNPRSLHPTDHWVPDSTAVSISGGGHIAVQTGNIYTLARFGYLLAHNSSSALSFGSSYTNIYLANSWNQPRAVNRSGLLVGNVRECVGGCEEPFRYDGNFKLGSSALRTNLPANSTQGYYAVNDLGVIAGIYTTNAPGGGSVKNVFLEYPDGRVVSVPGSTGMDINDLNNHNQMVGGSSAAVLYTDGRWFLLDSLIPGGGVPVLSARAINDRGWIAGQANFPGQGIRACLLTPAGYGQNQAPLANDDALLLNRPQSIQIPVAALLANDTDADNDEVHLFSVGDTNGMTQTGGKVQLSGRTIHYTPSANLGNDSFTYAVTDGNGGEATARVIITFDPLAPAPLQVLNPPEPQADGTIRLSGQAPPRWIVFIYQTANITAPYWTIDETLTTPASGQWSTTRPDMVNGVRVFYKVEIQEPWF